MQRNTEDLQQELQSGNPISYLVDQSHSQRNHPNRTQGICLQFPAAFCLNILDPKRDLVRNKIHYEKPQKVEHIDSSLPKLYVEPCEVQHI